MTSLPEPLFDVATLAELFNTTPRAIYRLVEKDPPELPYVRLGERLLRFEPAAIREYISARRRGPEVNGAESSG